MCSRVCVLVRAVVCVPCCVANYVCVNMCVLLVFVRVLMCVFMYFFACLVSNRVCCYCGRACDVRFGCVCVRICAEIHLFV